VLIDTHAHLEMSGDVREVIERATSNSVVTIIAVSSDLDSSRKSIELANTFPGIYCTVGIHPHEAASINEELCNELVSLASERRVVAIGETGLDYHYLNSPRENQIASFKRHIEISVNLDLPLIIHIREAFEDIIDILRERRSSSSRGVIHCFTGDYETAEEFIELGFYISFSGIVTFKNAEGLREAAKRIPVDKILIETDSPYLAPVPFRGKRNEPAYVKYVAEKIAEIRGTSFDEIAQITTSNANNLFKFNNISSLSTSKAN